MLNPRDREEGDVDGERREVVERRAAALAPYRGRDIPHEQAEIERIEAELLRED